MGPPVSNARSVRRPWRQSLLPYQGSFNPFPWLRFLRSSCCCWGWQGEQIVRQPHTGHGIYWGELARNILKKTLNPVK
jgi:hypothetical protein